jgi:hypothetical protein
MARRNPKPRHPKKPLKVYSGVTGQDFDYSQYKSGKIYPLANSIAAGYGVNMPGSNPSDRAPSARLINQRGEMLDLWVEEMEASFQMAGETAQSRGVRQFFPHNMVQPSITLRGRSPNSYQSQRLAAFVRVSQHSALHADELANAGVAIRNQTVAGQQFVIPTVRLIIRNHANGIFPYDGRWSGKREDGGRSPGVKGTHKPWILEGYIKSIQAGDQAHNTAPPFEFEFLISESIYKDNGIGIWNDTTVYGAALRPWMSWIKRKGAEVYIQGGGSTQPDPRDGKPTPGVTNTGIDGDAGDDWSDDGHGFE